MALGVPSRMLHSIYALYIGTYGTVVVAQIGVRDTLIFCLPRHPHHGASRPPTGGNVEKHPIGHRGSLVIHLVEDSLARFDWILTLTISIMPCQLAYFCVTFLTSSPPHISSTISNPTAVLIGPMAIEYTRMHCI